MDPAPVNDTPITLRDLIMKAQRRHGGSGRSLAAKAQARSFSIAHATINSIKSGTYHSRPGDDTLHALAWLAGEKDEVAFTAAGRRTPGPPLADELPPGVDYLSPKARRAVIDLLRVLVESEGRDGFALKAPADSSAGPAAGEYGVVSVDAYAIANAGSVHTDSSSAEATNVPGARHPFGHIDVESGSDGLY